MKKIVLFDYLNPGFGHLMLDDEYWVKTFIDLNLPFEVITSEESKRNLVVKNLCSEENIFSFKNFDWIQKINYHLYQIIRLLFSKKFKKSYILVQGFNEISLIPYLLLNTFFKNSFIIILTNNISNGRLYKNRILKILLKIIFSNSHTIIHHSDKEKKMINEIFNSKNKCFKKTYHLLSNNSSLQKESVKFKTITFFGPVKIDKPIESFIKLMESDKKNKFLYKILNVKEFKEKYPELYRKENVIVMNNYLSFEDFNNEIKSSRYIYLPHSKQFEPKLSGNLCDSLNFGIPFISNIIEPVIELSEIYGEMGYVFNLETNDWIDWFLQSECDDNFITFQKNITTFQEKNNQKKLKLEMEHFFYTFLKS
jgi:hypothetical protein